MIDDTLEKMNPNERFAYTAALRNMAGCKTTFVGGAPKMFTETLSRARSGRLSNDEQAFVEELRSGSIRVTTEPVRLKERGTARSRLERELEVRRRTLADLDRTPAVVDTRPARRPPAALGKRPARKRDGYLPPPAPPSDKMTLETCGVEVRMRPAAGERLARLVVTRSAYETILDAAQRHGDDRETGGGLYGYRPRGGEYRAFAATEAATDQERASCVIHWQDIEAAERRRSHPADNEILLGSFHTHPEGERDESPQDLYYWRLLLDRANLRHGLHRQLHLIVSADPERGWRRPVFTAYAVRMEEDGLGVRIIREPAEALLPR
jgi:proteasome lid subunit RPN8/RPN11